MIKLISVGNPEWAKIPILIPKGVFYKTLRNMATTQFKETLRSNDGNDDDDDFRYLVVRPEKGGIGDVFRCWVWPDGDGGRRFFESSEEGVFGAMVSGCRWVIVVSIMIRKIIAILAKPLEWTGNVVEFTLNLLSMNGNLSGLLCNIVRGEVVVPRRGTETFMSIVGLLDGRIDLLNEEKMLKGITVFVSEERSFGLEMENRNLVDLCVMASKLSYENEKVIQNIVLHHWKMHFVGFYNCWNDDWSTDFDYSWYEIPEVGKIHVGFLEALGLGNRNDASSFKDYLQAEASISSTASDVPHDSRSPSGHTRSTIPNFDQNIELDRLLPSLESEQFDGVTPEVVQLTAYYAVKHKLRRLLMEHRNAKFVVTGHSLGGALAVLFPTVLVLHKEMEIMGRLSGVYTFGQPRVGNKQLGQFMEAYLMNPIPRYFRFVYCNDIVPRLPYDDKAFFFKHFGVCLYYDSLFTEHVCTFSNSYFLWFDKLDIAILNLNHIMNRLPSKNTLKVDEEPNKNFFGIRYLIPEYLNALWELIRSLLMGYTHGVEYREGWVCTLVRVIGLALPGISAHCLTNYIDSVRLGKKNQSL
ncbi:triacylglycerol lipase OBL1 isoform X3 [Benincasa hispida]|uniref:triacylglycerol lipase OBL1 isoform X3 n=1 Tax=Benincasa hispida TaxID=102211 RepID=UPI0019026EC7|nr:triacylglycerol lipase OBL1 isoform X3 [Benincasa hispida]